MSDELEHLRKQVQFLQQENERLRANVTRRQQDGASAVIDYQAIFHQVPIAVLVYQLDGLLIEANGAVEQMYRVPGEAAIGTYNVLENPDNIKLGVPDYFEKTRNGEISQLPASRVTNQNVAGRNQDVELWVSTLFIPLRSAAGDVIQVLALDLDMTDQKKIEQSRDELQEQILRNQEEVIRELSTPLVPIAEGVIAMPLVGQLNRRRILQATEVLLQGISDYQAEQVILDVTGVSDLDDQVAQDLLQMARAVRLLGSRLVLTGISAVMARTLVLLDAKLEGIITLGTFQNGITYALTGRMADEPTTA